MASVYRKTVTRKLPANAELFVSKGQRMARWKDRTGKRQTAAVIEGSDGSLRIRSEVRTYTAKYRDGSGLIQESATGCRDKTAALAVLRDLVARAERVKSGLVSTGDDAAMDYQHTSLVELLAVYIEHLRAKGRSTSHIADCDRLTKRAFDKCGFVTLRDIETEPLERWLTSLTDSGLSPRTRNSYLQAIRGFFRWCIGTRRLQADPTERISKAAETVDIRRQRRALTIAELERLLFAARWRPLAEQGRETIPSTSPKGRSTWRLAPLTFNTLPTAISRAREKLADKPGKITELETLGRERELVYKTLVLTGLRRGELASLTIGSLVLNETVPYAILEAGNAKNRQRSEIPLRDDLTVELAQWIAAKQQAHNNQSEVVLSFETALNKQLSLDTPLFTTVTREFLKVLNRDIAAADIDKTDERGHTIDVHALRHTYGSLLSAGGVAPRTAQAAMRHSSIDLTMNVYTDPRVLDIHGALDSLPKLQLDKPLHHSQRQLATGTNDLVTERQSSQTQRVVAPTVAPNSDERSISLVAGDNWEEKNDCTKERSHPRKPSVSRETKRVANGVRTHDLRNHKSLVFQNYLSKNI